MMELSENSVTSLSFPVEYSEIPEGYVLTDTTVEQINIQFRAVGFSILAEKYLKSRSTLRIELHETYPSEDGNTRYLLSRTLRQQLNEELGPNREILNISPDTIRMNVSERVEKKVPISIAVDIAPKERFFVSRGPFVSPDSATVMGPASILDTLSTVTTATEQIAGIVKSDTVNVPLSPQHPLVTSKMKSVKVSFQIDELTERKIRIPIQVKNSIAKGDRVRTFPDSVEVAFTVGLRDYDKISQNDFVAQLQSMDEVDLESVRKLQVELVRIPEEISNVSFTPERVAFVIEQKED
ncbi:CdaR family protein [Halocola ammonii]